MLSNTFTILLLFPILIDFIIRREEETIKKYFSFLAFAIYKVRKVDDNLVIPIITILLYVFLVGKGLLKLITYKV